MLTWKSKLNKVLNEKTQTDEKREARESKERFEVKQFYSLVVMPVFEELQLLWEKHDRQVKVIYEHNVATVTVFYKGIVEFEYTIRVKRHARSNRVNTHYGYNLASYNNNMEKIYTARQVRCIKKTKVAKHIVSQYEQSILPRKVRGEKVGGGISFGNRPKRLLNRCLGRSLLR